MANVAWNPLDIWSDLELTNDNTTVRKTSTGSYHGVRGTVSHSTGLRYFEAIVPSGGEGAIGFATAAADLNQPLGYGSYEGLGVYNDGTAYSGPGGTGSSQGELVHQTIGFLLDLTARKAWIRAANGNWSHGGNPTAGGSGIDISHLNGAIFPMFTGFYADDTSTIFSNADTITQPLPAGATLWGDAGTTRKPIRSVYWL